MERDWSVYENMIEINLYPIAEMWAEEDGDCKKFARAFYGGTAAKEFGYLNTFLNCAFNLLHNVFGADVVAYLFDKEWIPTVKPVRTVVFPSTLVPPPYGTMWRTVVKPFRPALFLERLTVLDTTIKQLRDEAITPILLPETAPYRRGDGGITLKQFREKHHRLALDFSLSELRGFGELGRSHCQDPFLSASILFGVSYGHGEFDASAAKQRLERESFTVDLFARQCRSKGCTLF
jgi:hypothetical protein